MRNHRPSWATLFSGWTRNYWHLVETLLLLNKTAPGGGKGGGECWLVRNFESVRYFRSATHKPNTARRNVALMLGHQQRLSRQPEDT